MVYLKPTCFQTKLLFGIIYYVIAVQTFVCIRVLVQIYVFNAYFHFLISVFVQFIIQFDRVCSFSWHLFSFYLFGFLLFGFLSFEFQSFCSVFVRFLFVQFNVHVQVFVRNFVQFRFLFRFLFETSFMFRFLFGFLFRFLFVRNFVRSKTVRSNFMFRFLFKTLFV